MIKVGEFFAAINLKGADLASKQLGQVGKQFKNLKLDSLAFKASVIGAFYGLAQMIDSATSRGVTLGKFLDTSNVDQDFLSRVTVAMRQTNTSAEETISLFRNIVNLQAEMIKTGGPYHAFERLVNVLGPASVDMQKFRTDAQYAFDALQKYAKAEQNVILRRDTLQALGADESIQSSLIINKRLDPESLAAIRPEYSKGQIDAMRRQGAALEELRVKYQRLQDQIALTFGPDAIKAASALANGIRSILIPAMKEMADLGKSLNVDFFSQLIKMGAVLYGIINPLQGVIGLFALILAEMNAFKKGEKGPLRNELDDVRKRNQDAFAPLLDFKKMIESKEYKEMQKSLEKGLQKSTSFNDMPPVLRNMQGVKTSNNTNNLELNLYFNGDGSNAQEIGDSVSTKVRQAMAQLPAYTAVV